MGVCNCSMFCCTLLYVHPSIAIILMGKRELVALLNLSSWCLVMVERLFLAVPWGCLRFVIVVFPDHTHLLFLTIGKLHGRIQMGWGRRFETPSPFCLKKHKWLTVSFKVLVRTPPPEAIRSNAIGSIGSNCFERGPYNPL